MSSGREARLQRAKEAIYEKFHGYWPNESESRRIEVALDAADAVSEPTPRRTRSASSLHEMPDPYKAAAAGEPLTPPRDALSEFKIDALNGALSLCQFERDEARATAERLREALSALVGPGELRMPIVSLDVNRDEYEAARALLAESAPETTDV